jgi:hypothetical protein
MPKNDLGYEPFRPRAIRFEGVREVRGYRLKLYSISVEEGSVPPEEFEGGFDLAFRELPDPAVSEGRPGLGFVIAHRGRGIDYVVLSWWDRENELPTRVFAGTGGEWRVARGGESFCVWDLEVLWREREAYVQTVLTGSGEEGSRAYLARVAGKG